VTGPAQPGAGRTNDGAERPRYTLDSTDSRFIVQAFSGGLLSALGHDPRFVARDLAGEVSFDPDAPDEASLTMTLRAESLALVDDVSDRDRRTIERTMHHDVLEDSRFPEIVYHCPRAAVRSVGRGQLEVALRGELTLHGVARTQSITAKLITAGQMLRASGEFTLRQSDYDIKPVSFAGGTLRVKDELKCSFDIVARR
jgi:polyisoprenoid-binding protein YceI